MLGCGLTEQRIKLITTDDGSYRLDETLQGNRLYLEPVGDLLGHHPLAQESEHLLL